MTICRSDRQGGSGAGLRACLLLAALSCACACACACGELFFDGAPIDVNVTFDVDPLPDTVAFTFLDAEVAPCTVALVEAPSDPDGVYGDPGAPLQVIPTDGTATMTQRFATSERGRRSFIAFALSARPNLQGRDFAPIEQLETGRGCGEREASVDPQTLDIVVRPVE